MMPRVSVDEVRKLAPVEPSSVDETSKDGGAILSAPVQRIKVMLAIDGLGLGGSEVVVRALARGLDRAWFDVAICCTKGLGGAIGEGLLNDGFDVFVLPGQRSGRVDYLSSLKLRSAAVERRIDILHTHGTSALLDAGLCKLTLPRVKLVHTFHYGNYPYDSWRRHVLEGTLARTVDRLVAVGVEQRRQIQKAYRLPESRFGVIRNGVTPASSTPPAKDFRGAVGTGDRLLVGTVAKFIEQKGLDHLLLAARKCLDAGDRMHFVIVGGGPLRESFERRRRELGLDDAVTTTGWIPDAAANAVPAFDVFFQPSRWEAMSIAILEAMTNGKPIVATRVGDNVHTLSDGTTGLLVDTGDIDGMVAALRKMSDPKMRERLGKAAREDFEQRFTLGHMIRSYEQVYRELAGY
jgi:glycosyltransferase involved in cell wall biosynthesis